jgi:hypothetical protein
MTFNLDPDVVIRAGRTAVDEAAALRDAAALIDFGPTLVEDGAARDRLIRRVRRLSARLGANGRSLQAFVREAEAADTEVSFSFLVMSTTEWR